MAHPVLGRCPVCGDVLSVTRLHCRQCDTVIEGQFSLGRLHELTPDELFFVETFIRCEGKLNRVEEELGISYPTVRNRLNQVIRSMGYEVKDDAGLTPDERKAILERLENGDISSEEAIKLLREK